MHNFIAGCGAGVSQNCLQYATSSWTPGGTVLGVIILVVVIAGVMMLKRRSS